MKMLIVPGESCSAVVAGGAHNDYHRHHHQHPSPSPGHAAHAVNCAGGAWGAPAEPEHTEAQPTINNAIIK